MKNHNKTNLLANLLATAFLLLQLTGGSASADYRGYWVDAVQNAQNTQTQNDQSQAAYQNDGYQVSAPYFAEPDYQEPQYQPVFEPAPQYGNTAERVYNAG